MVHWHMIREGEAVGKRVTIQDIADAIGVSRNTVSKALNNAEGIAEATRFQILQTAMEMGYKQFAFTSSLPIPQMGVQTATTEPSGPREVALFTTIFLGGSHFASLMLDRLQHDLAEAGYTLNTHRVSEQNLEELSLPITFSTERTAAMVCIEMFDRPYNRMICELGLPMLFVDCPARTSISALPADQLLMDNESGIATLVNDMLAAGKDRIGFIGDFDHCQSFFERYMGFRLAMHMEGASVNRRTCIKENHEEGIALRLAKLKELGEMPQLFICANDFVAIEALWALRGLGLDVPTDVMLAGFDDSPESRTCMPPLTTVHIHTQTMGYAAMDLIMARIKEPLLDFRKVTVQADLIYRDSARIS